MRDDHWDVFWAQLFWLIGVLLAAVPFGIDVWSSASFKFDGNWSQAFDAHYRELAAYTMVISAIGSADAFEAAHIARQRNTLWHVGVVVIWVGSLLFLVGQLANLIMVQGGKHLLAVPVQFFPLAICWAFFSKTVAELERRGRNYANLP
jgi:hypothetical protein